MRRVRVLMQDERPCEFQWKRRRVTVESCVDYWSEQGRWWDGEKRRLFFLVQTERGLFLLCRNAGEEVWYGKPVQ